jgi:hypothetical protein
MGHFAQCTARRVESIPLLGSGKIDYVSLKKMAEAPG